MKKLMNILALMMAAVLCSTVVMVQAKNGESAKAASHAGLQANAIPLSTTSSRALNPKPVMYKGTVKFFNQTKGFGFIIESGSRQEIFVHVSGLVDEIRQGDNVTFDTQRGKKGMNAVNVRLA